MEQQPSGLRVTAESRLASESRIYVNRNLRMGSVHAIGFDLDHTLAHYRGPAVEESAYTLARHRLVERFGYPEELESIAYNRDFVIRGLVIDKRRGNILKMDYHNYVARGFHGLRQLRAEERKTAYRSRRVRMSSEAYVTVDTLFHLPEVYLYVVLVDLMERTSKGKKPSFQKIYTHVRESIDSVHGDGSLKKEILGDLPRFIRRDSRLPLTLEELRRVGKKLFLLTNSEYYYTDALLTYLLESDGREHIDWQDMFHLIVVDAGKPSFFTARPGEREAKPFPIEGSSTPAFQGGNARHLESVLGFSGDQMLYFGDHTYGDILRSKKSLGWRTAMVVEELADEMKVSRTLRPQLDELAHWKALRGMLESDLSLVEMDLRKAERKLEKEEASGVTGESKARKRFEALSTKKRALDRELKQVKRTTSDIGELVNKTYNKYWGPIFREGQETSRFGHQVKDFACLYMTSVVNMLNYTPSHYFRSPDDRMPHEEEL